MPDVHLTRVYDRSREDVFAAWTEPDRVAAWWGPDKFVVPRTSVEIELRPGGRFHPTMLAPDGTAFPVRNEVVEVDPPRLLVLRAEPQPELGVPDATVTRVELHDMNGRTRLTLTSGPYTDEWRPNAKLGWAESLDLLGEELKRKEDRPWAD